MITASIVLFHHSCNDITKLLNCLLNSSISTIYIIDNSNSDVLRSLTKISTKIIYIHNINNGYGNAHNIAIHEAIEIGSVYHVIINPDIYFKKGVIEELSYYMDQNPSCGLLMPKILYPNGEIQYLCKLLPTPLDLFVRRFIPLKKINQNHDYRYELHFTNYDKIMEVPSLSGCFMFIRTDILKQIGGFDEQYFMYAEDIDLCRRIRKTSKTLFYPFVHVYHKYEKGSYKNKKLLKYHICSVIKYFNKWGWFFDRERKLINKQLFDELNYKQ